MIYLFRGVAEICKVPGRLCSLCGELFKQIHCEPVKKCCDRASRGCSSFVERPLSSFVVITTVMSVLEIAYLGMTLILDSIERCPEVWPKDAWVTPNMWCLVQALFAVLNVVFAPYFQCKVWQQLEEEAEAEERLKTQPVIDIEKEDVVKSFKFVFMHDFGVLFYVFALIASFIWCCKGYTWITAGGALCNPDQGLSYAANIGWAFFFIFFLYTLAWYYCGCCAKNTQIRGDSVSGDHVALPTYGENDPV